jgi:Phosphoglucomutase/phosphomannomutase, alpha/beta/alpha domain I
MRTRTYLSLFIHRILVAGDGRYFNAEAMQIMCRILAANGVANIWLPSGGIMSTPAVSAAIRTRQGGICQGGIILTASHNPGGPGEDFGTFTIAGYTRPGTRFTLTTWCKCILFIHSDVRRRQIQSRIRSTCWGRLY